MNTQTHISASPAQTVALGRVIGHVLPDGGLVTLDGPLGSGKTCFVRGMAEGMGIDPDDVSSPTFVICHEHAARDERQLVHMDAYRIEDVDELETFGWTELLARASTAIALEWPSRVSAALPEPTLRIEFEHLGEEERGLTLSGDPEVLHAVTRALKRSCPICESPVGTTASTFPFCSSRCRLVDLGKWMGGEYMISRPMQFDEDLD